jgi:VCBS repeat-containing protein
VLANDSDPDGDALSVQSFTQGANGSVTENADGTISYTPAAGFSGSDSFTYVVGDGNGGFATAAVSVIVTADPINHAPVAVDDTFTVSQDETLSVNGVLNNDVDADGDALTASLVWAPTHGTLALNSDGSFSYTPDAGFFGTDGFIYRAKDGEGGADTATAFITVTATADPINHAPVAANDAVHIEAEAMNLQGYEIQSWDAASGGQLIGTWSTGSSAEVAFQGASGLYALTVDYFDENDGVSAARVFINGEQKDAWIFDQDLGAAVPDATNLVERTIGEFQLNPGDVIRLEGDADVGEAARFDGIDFVEIA